jgi:hypothetical protein
MPGETVRIDELHLRVPGLSAGEAKSFAEEVARRVAEELPLSGRQEQVGLLDLHLTFTQGTRRDRLAGAVAEKILAGLI